MGHNPSNAQGYIALPLDSPYPHSVLAIYNSDINFFYYAPAFLSYRQDTTPEILARATDAVMAIRKYAQELPDFQATWTFIATWHDSVPYGAVIADPQAVSLNTTFCSHAARKLEKCFYLKKIDFHHNSFAMISEGSV